MAGGQFITSARGTVVKSVSVALLGLAITSGHGIVVATTGKVVELVGSASTSATGTVVQSSVRAVSGQALTGSQGDVTTRLKIQSSTGTATANSILPVAGQFLTGAQGLVYQSVLTGSNLSVLLRGQVSTSALGTVQVPRTFALTGSVSTSARGTVTPGLRPTDIVGQVITSARGTMTPAGNDVTVSISLGTPITSAQGFVGSNQLTGQVITSTHGVAVPEVERSLIGLLITSGLGTLQANQEAEEDTYISSALETPSLLMEVPLLGAASTSGTGSVGITSDQTIALTGSESVSAAGTMIYTPLVNLFGEDATVETGNVSTPASVDLVGLQFTGLQGTVFTTQDRSVALIGAEASVASGFVVATSRHGLNGVVLTSDSGVLGFTTDGMRQLLGQSTTLAAGVMVPLADRTFMLTGQTMTAAQGLTFANNDGTIKLLGQSMTGQQGNVGAPNVVRLTGLQILSVQAAFSHPVTESFPLNGLEVTVSSGVLTADGSDVGTPSGSNEGCHIISEVAQEACPVVSQIAQERSDIASGIATESNTNEV